jgi:hypothetical protein
LVGLLVLVRARETPLDPEEEVLDALAEQKFASKFFKVFAISAKLTDFAVDKGVAIEY